MKIPNWASDLVNQVSAEYRKPLLPNVIWRRRHSKKEWNEKYQMWEKRNKSNYSSGTTYSEENKIVVTAGSSRKDQKLVLLHELAHWLMPADENHGKAFWDLAFDLYRKYKVPMYYALNREKNYRQEAKFAYRRNRNKLKS